MKDERGASNLQVIGDSAQYLNGLDKSSPCIQLVEIATLPPVAHHNDFIFIKKVKNVA